MPLLLSHRPVAGPGDPPASNLTDRRRALCSLGAALLVGGTPRASRAQGAAPYAGAAAPSAELATPGWPNRPLRMMVGFGAGSTPDLVARLVAEPLSQALGQPVIVENHAGASGNIAAALVARASDLHTIGMLINGNMTIARLLNPATPYEPQKDLQPLSLVCVAPMVLAASVSLPGAEGPGFAAAAKSMGNRWSYGSPGVGTLGHLGMEVLKARTGWAPVHVPYQGNPQVITAMAGGQIQMALLPPGLARVQVEAGKLRAIGATALRRSALVPDIPTLAEAGLPETALEIWTAAAAPATLPAPIAQRLARLIAQITQSQDVGAKLFRLGYEPVGSSAQVLRERVQADTLMLGDIIRRQHISHE
jgi:tripartite-type tricarboxylate transporter receptor subunit TctC